MTINYKLRAVILLVFVFIDVGIFLSPIYFEKQSAAAIDFSNEKLLTVSFLDVGQGDAIYIETFDGVQVLIDGGPDDTVLRELSEQMPAWDRDIDVVIVTHTDKDHVGGLIEVFNRYDVKNIIYTKNKNDSAIAEALIESIDIEDANKVLANAGQIVQLGASTSLAIISPQGDPTNWESNSSSVVSQLRFGDIEFMLTGDAPANIEEYLVGNFNEDLESEVLKLGHHGSKTSTSDSFLDVTAPRYAVISAGKNNSYGHPHEEVVSRLKERDINTVSTSVQGTVVFESDGSDVWLK